MSGKLEQMLERTAQLEARAARTAPDHVFNVARTPHDTGHRGGRSVNRPGNTSSNHGDQSAGALNVPITSDQDALSPLAKSAVMSFTASNPTAMRNNPSVIPAASRLSWLIRA